MVGIERDPAKEVERQARINAHKEAILQEQQKRKDDINVDRFAALKKEAEERAAAFQALKEAEEQTVIQEAKQRQASLDETRISIRMESPGQKLWRKFKENPFVPLGKS